MAVSFKSERAATLIEELARHERLQEWLGRCSINSIWYLCDPIGAIRSANVGIDEAVLKELESSMLQRFSVVSRIQERKAS